MRYPALYIKSIYASHISLYSMRASLTRIIYERILGYVIEAPIMVIEVPIMVIEVSIIIT